MEIVRLKRSWQLGAELAVGGVGRIHLAMSDSGEAAVARLIPLDVVEAAKLTPPFDDFPGLPNILPLWDRGEWNGFWVTVTPRAEKSLRARLVEQGGGLPLEEGTTVLAAAATALCGLEGKAVHRNLKPENLLLHNGGWELADPGVSRLAQPATGAAGQFPLNPSYAAPELWRGDGAGRAADVYALGVIAYEIFTGERPFRGPRPEDYREQHLHGDPPPLPNVPAWLADLAAECLLKAPQARPAPANIKARIKPVSNSPAAQRLQRARLELMGKKTVESAAQSQPERRAAMFQAAEQAFNGIMDALRDEILANAPECGKNAPLPWSFCLNSVTLSIEPCQAAAEFEGVRHKPAFDIIAASRVSISFPVDRWNYAGRAHSLWYCDAQEAGVFRWHETAFTVNLMMAPRGPQDPIALDPGLEAFGALSPVLTEIEPAWPFTPIDRGKEKEFIERWIAWFADAVSGDLRRPSAMPERDLAKSWRRW